MSATEEPIRAPKTSELVAERIRRRIVRGELKEGDTLPAEADAMAEFGVSRPSMREAFRLLESEQLIEIRRGSRGGATVVQPRARVATKLAGLILQIRGTTIGDVHTARLGIEPLAAGLLAERATDDDIVALEQALDAEAAHLDDPGAYTRASADFHETVMALCGNEPLHLCFEVLRGIIDRDLSTATAQRPAPHEDIEASHRSHVKLVKLVRDGGHDRARRHWDRHLQATAGIVIEGRAGQSLIELFD